jgi:beta-glucanase (GH16 family)
MASLGTGQTSTSAAECTVAAAGDVAGSDDYQTGASVSAELIKNAHPAALLALGDLAYDNGTPGEFDAFYTPTWGQFASVTKPVPGNHEYVTGGTGYFAYFGVPEFYSFDVCGWRAVALNGEIGHAPQIAYLKAQRAAHPRQPFLVYWHEPRWSSGSEHGNDPSYQDFWQAAADVGAEIVLNAHDHDYERFARMDARGAALPNGPREFVVGTGGHHLRGFGTIRPHSEARVTGSPGILLLALGATSLSWQYRDSSGVQDSGTDEVRDDLAPSNATGGTTPTTNVTPHGRPGDGGSAPATSTSAAAPPPGGPSVTFSDDFEGPAGTAPDPDKWQNEVGGQGYGNHELEYYSDTTRNVALDGMGHLVITARRERPAGSSCWYGDCQYSSGKLTTKETFSQRYGHVEARIKLPRGKGLWPAFWMVGDDIDKVGWPESGEIDIMEADGSKISTNESSIHGPGYTDGVLGAAVRAPAGRTLADDFHVYAMDWAPGRITFSLDGAPFRTFTSSQLKGKPWVFDHPFFMLLNLAVGGGSVGAPDQSTDLPQSLVVDYVRVDSADSSPGSRPRTVSTPSAGPTRPVNPPPGPSTPPSRLLRGFGGLCLTALDGGPTSGSVTWLARCDGGSRQRWTQGAGSSLHAVGGCLGVAPGRTGSGAPVGIYRCNGTPTQSWRVGPKGSLRALDRCLDVTYVRSAREHYRLQLSSCRGTSDQRWSFSAA